MRKVWEETKQILLDGLKFEKINGKYRNNLPKASDNPVCHVRPHGKTRTIWMNYRMGVCFQNNVSGYIENIYCHSWMKVFGGVEEK